MRVFERFSKIAGHAVDSSRRVLSWRSLKTRVAVFTLGIFVASVWSLFLYANHRLHDDLTRELSAQQMATVSYAAGSINEDLRSRVVALDRLAKALAPLMNHPAVVEATLTQHTTLALLFNAGVVVVGRDGIAIGDLPQSTGRIGIDYRGDEWIDGTFSGGRPMIGRPVMGKKLKVPVFVTTAPIRGTDGTVIGVVAGVVNLTKQNFLNEISMARYGRSGGYVLVAPQHRVIVTASDPRLVMTAVHDSGRDPLVDRFLQGYEGSGIMVDSHGVQVLASARRIPVAGWYLVASLPTSEAFAPIRGIQSHLLLAAIVLTILVAAVTWWMLQRHLAPMLVTLKTLSSRSTTGQSLEPLPIVRQDEVGELIGGFNRLLRALADREAALTESDARHRTILQTTMDGFLLLDMEGRLLEVNGTFCRMTGYSESDLLTMHIGDMAPGDARTDRAERMGKLMERGEDRWESRLRRRDGSILHVEISAQYRPIEGGRLVGFVRDISERQQAEQENLSLETQLRQSQKLESVGLLAGGVAHDFNNMLGVILGTAEMALGDVDPSQPLHGELLEIRKAAERSAVLTRHLLTFARQQAIAPEQLNLNEAVPRLLTMLQRLIGEDIHLHWQPAMTLWPILMDASQMDQILTNLCVNARHAIADVGTIALATANCSVDAAFCARHMDASPGDYVRLTVSDSGCGMEEAVRARIFEPFFTTKKRGEGTGLGLASVYGAVRQNGGFITVESEPGAGTTFEIYLPRLVGSQAPARLSGEFVALDPEGHETVLLVEDEPAILRLATRMLEARGYRVLSASTPHDAIRLSIEHGCAIDLLLSDVVMPGMNGRDLAQEVMSRCPNLRLLFMSGYAAEGVSGRSISAYDVPIIEKPFTPMTLVTKVREVLDAPSRQAHTIAR